MRKILKPFIIIFLFSLVEASCCYDPTIGLCLDNVNKDNCKGVLAQSCKEIEECTKGCCIIGSAVYHTSQKECELRAQEKKFSFVWQKNKSVEECLKISSLDKLGACIYPFSKDKECIFTRKSSCKGNFFEGILCSSPLLNTSCRKTNIKKCFEDGNIYYVDSCGNRDELFERCNYEEGFICKQEISKEASCKSIHCKDEKNNTRFNGESWCSGDTKEGKVGTRDSIKTCVNGKIIEEPCADYRFEYCSEESIKPRCVRNIWRECIAANKIDEKTKKVKIENCNERNCFIWKPNASEYGVSQQLLDDLKLELCVPKRPIGENFLMSWNEMEEICKKANYEEKVSIKDIYYCPYYCGIASFSIAVYPIRGFSSNSYRYSKIYPVIIEGDSFNNFGKIGIMSLNITDWDFQFSINRLIYPNINGSLANFFMNPNLHLQRMMIDNSYYFETNKSIPDRTLIEILNKRASLLGDCGEIKNWLNQSGSNKNILNVFTTRNKEKIEVNFVFNVSVWSPPTRGECEKCNNQDFFCSEYRCLSIGKNCAYREEGGIDKGVCYSREDITSPKISHEQTPLNPVPPFEAVRIILKTDEDSKCRFDFSNTKEKIEEMQYEIDKSFKKIHEIVLYPPGKIIEEEVPSYPLIKEGKMSIFVRCEDLAGNYNVAPYLISLDIMKIPDNLPPIIINTSPPSRSFIKNGLKEKEVTLYLNEPSECRWDFEDVNFDLMKNEFSCSQEISYSGSVYGYPCRGELQNLSNEIGEIIKVYIRCKDQPWLDRENQNSTIYSRNENKESFEYILMPSSPLDIYEFSPEGEYFIGSNKKNLTIQTKTKEGAENGKAKCQWRIIINNITTAWQDFERTNSVIHTQTIQNIEGGNYIIGVRCEDIAQNIEERNYSVNVEIDREGPKIRRIYQRGSNVKVVFDEKAKCKIIESNECSSAFINGTILSTLESNEISFYAVRGKKYTLTCEDVFGNYKCYREISFS
ncbi:MAG: hypothetical protein QW273_00505 [Candidatus Pacearchaeota archaeon]